MSVRERDAHIQPDILSLVDAAGRLRVARRLAGLSQAELARRASTSQATVSAYESARTQPSVATLSRLLAAAGARLTVEHGKPSIVLPSPADHAGTARALSEVLSLAASLPVHHEPRLRYEGPLGLRLRGTGGPARRCRPTSVATSTTTRSHFAPGRGISSIWTPTRRRRRAAPAPSGSSRASSPRTSSATTRRRPPPRRMARRRRLTRRWRSTTGLGGRISSLTISRCGYG